MDYTYPNEEYKHKTLDGWGLDTTMKIGSLRIFKNTVYKSGY